MKEYIYIDKRENVDRKTLKQREREDKASRWRQSYSRAGTNRLTATVIRDRDKKGEETGRETERWSETKRDLDR